MLTLGLIWKLNIICSVVGWGQGIVCVPGCMLVSECELKFCDSVPSNRIEGLARFGISREIPLIPLTLSPPRPIVVLEVEDAWIRGPQLGLAGPG